MRDVSAQQQGFTLLEVLIAIAIFAVMAAMAYGGLNRVIQTKTTLQQTQARLTEIQKAVFRIQSDLEAVQIRPVRDSLGQSLPALFYHSDFSTTPILELTRGGVRNPMELKRASLERVRYELQRDEKGKGYHLLRQRWVVLDRANDEGLRGRTLLTQIESLNWRFLDAQDQWQTVWPPSNLPISEQTDGTRADIPTPKAVELTLKLPDLGELKFLFAIPTAPTLPTSLQSGTSSGQSTPSTPTSTEATPSPAAPTSTPVITQ